MVFWHALFVEDNRHITASFLYINLLPFLADRVLGIPEIKLKVILDQLVWHCEICIIYAVPPGNTNKLLYKEKKSSDSYEIMFFQNKQYTTLEVVGTESGAVQAIVFCILQGKAARSAQLLERAASERERMCWLALQRNRRCIDVQSGALCVGG